MCTIKALSSTTVALVICCSGRLVFAAETGEVTPPIQTDDNGQPPKVALIDKTHESVDNLVQSTVRRIDGFFVNSEFATFNDEKTRVRLRLNTDYIQYHGWEVKPKIKLHLVLPGLNERLRLVVNDDQGTNESESTAGTDNDNDVALRWIGRQKEHSGVSFDLGLRIKSGKVDPFGRINAGIEYPLLGKWVGQSTNRLYYYKETGWRNDFRQYVNRYINDKLLVRSRTRVQYFEENVYNPFVEQKFSLYHSWKEDRKLAYELVYRRTSIEDSPFDEGELIGELKNDYTRFLAQIRYRQTFLRPWLFVEFWPIIGWPEERDYDTTLAARLRVEVNLGGLGDKRLDE